MNKKEIEVWLKDRTDYHSNFLYLNQQLANVALVLTNKVKKAKIHKISEEMCGDGYYSEAIMSIKDECLTLRLYAKTQNSSSFKVNSWLLMGYDNPPVDSYPEFTIYEGKLTNDLIIAFENYAKKFLKRTNMIILPAKNLPTSQSK